MSDAAAKRRARQTLINLLLSLGATLGLVLLLILAVPRDDSNRIQPVDYKEIAAEAQNVAPGELLVPVLPDGWYSNSARYRSAEQDGVANWYVGFVGPNSEYLAFTQGFEVNQTWLALQLESNKPTGEKSIAGRTWTIYENPKVSSPPKSRDYLMLLETEEGAILVYGVAPLEEFEKFAQAISDLIPGA